MPTRRRPRRLRPRPRPRPRWTKLSSRAHERPNALRWTAKSAAATAMDSITAEDVGSFPDQNVNEAISRIAGVALDRGDNGEGRGISVRGNGPEFTRVDIDGMTVLNTNGALAGGASSATGGRSADLRELPAAIIKTIDVFKGTTADMTEGSLGGSVHIETRNGLDFDKPYLSARHRRPAQFHHRKVDAERYGYFRQQIHGRPPWRLRQRHLFEIRDRFRIFNSRRRRAMPGRSATPISINRRKRPLPTIRALLIRPRRPGISVFSGPAACRPIRRCRPSTS